MRLQHLLCIHVPCLWLDLADTHLCDNVMSELAMFTPPRVIGAALDRALFSKRIPLAAGRVLSLKNISKIRSSLEKNKDLLRIERIGSVRRDPDPTLAERGGKCLLLSPTVKIDGRCPLLLSRAIMLTSFRSVDMELISRSCRTRK